MNWDYLDKMDKNALYLYAQSFKSPNGKQLCRKAVNPVYTGNQENDDFYENTNRCKTAFYIIWFVFRYVLECETLEDAKKCISQETLTKYKLNSLFSKRDLFLGVYGVGEIYLYKPLEGDLDVVLEILYNRLDFFEQMELFIKYSQEHKRMQTKRCADAINTYRKLLENNDKYAWLSKVTSKKENADA